MPLAPHLTFGRRWTFVGGKGGVGKTTVAAALALELAAHGEAVTILSTDPAHSLGDAFGHSLSPEPAPLPDAPGIEAFEIDAEHERELFMREHGPSVSALIERGTYLDTDDATAVAGLPVPGMDELGALLRLGRLAAARRGRVILDTAPTGHTLRLLDLPRLALGWVAALEAMEAKHAAVASAFGAGPVGDAPIEFLRGLRADLEALDASFRDPDETRFILVTTGEPGVIAETLRYRDELGGRGIALGGVVVNRQLGSSGGASPGDREVYVPPLPDSPDGLEGLRRFAAAASAIPGSGSREAGLATGPVHDVQVGESFLPPLDRRLYFVGGKGGVGKTTVAAAIARRIAVARTGAVLLLSVDPAGSLSDVLGSPIGPEPAQPTGFEPLFAQQLDAAAAWADFTRQYRDEVDALFDGLGSGAFSASLDREVIERLIDLAPPGVDELMALVEVVDAIEDGEYDALVLDAAPSGHFLRLLEMPELALEWTHSVLRLLLKYREVVRLEGLGEKVLGLSRTLRRLRETLADDETTWVVVVALPESLSVPETARLIPRLAGLGLATGALLVNRALSESGEVLEATRGATVRLLGIDPAIPGAGAPLLRVGPAGAAAIDRFIAGWRTIRLDPHRRPPDARYRITDSE